MKINEYVIISSSTRQNSQSKKVADYIANNLAEFTQKENVKIIDFSEEIFPLWDEEIWSNGISWNPVWSDISAKLKKSDAIIIIAPEWNGMAPPQLMNFFQLCSNQELSHKPGLIVSVSSGQGGSYPIAEIRMGSFKNTKICYMPEQIIVRDVKNVLNNVDSPVSENDQYIRERIHNALELLSLYAEAFKDIRRHDLVKTSRYPYGM